MKVGPIAILFSLAIAGLSQATEVSIQIALDVIKWARFGSEKFDYKYPDQKLMSKKTNFVVYGEVFERMAKEGKLPKGYTVVNDKTLKNVDWSTTGCISVEQLTNDGRILISGTLGPLGTCSDWLVEKDGKYNLKNAGGS